MRVISERQLAIVLGALPGTPRVVAGGNFATPRRVRTSCWCKPRCRQTALCRAVPDAVLAGLHGRRGLAVWSEMFSDGVLGLAKAGALDPGQPVTASFAFGSADLYAWMDRNPDVRMLRTETVNDPARIARRPRMASVNSALQVDLFAQANATWVNGRVHSGFGGQTDFVVGALHSCMTAIIADGSSNSV